MAAPPRVQAAGRTTVEQIGVTVVVPAFNEGESVGTVVTALKAVLSTTGWPFEVIVVDDGSTDGTADAAEQSQARVLRHPANRGYGAAIKTGIRHARYELVCITDADGTYPTERIPDLVAHLAQHESDMVVGARSGQDAAIPLMRRPAKWILGTVAQMVAGEPIPDLNSGLRVFRREAALRFFHLLPDGFSYTTTITLAMISSGYLVAYVPISYHPRVGSSKIRPVRDMLNFTGLILRIALYFAPLKFFMPVSGALGLLALAWALVSKIVLGNLADVSTVIILVVAVQVAVVGLLAEMLNRRLPNYYQDHW